jgi:hypothetical protein
VYQKENGIARGSEDFEKTTMKLKKSTFMVLIPFLGISTINDRIAKNEDVFLKRATRLWLGAHLTMASFQWIF